MHEGAVVLIMQEVGLWSHSPSSMLELAVARPPSLSGPSTEEGGPCRGRVGITRPGIQLPTSRGLWLESGTCWGRIT